MSPTPFHDLEAYQELPRLGGLALSPDGTRLVTTVATPGPDGTRFRPALWEVDPTGAAPARRLTRGSGESAPVFTPDGELLFLSARPDPARAEQPDEAPAAMWLLPPGGEAYVVGTRPGGIAAPAVARATGTVVVTSMTMPSATTAEDDTALRKVRKDRKVSGILHTGYPVRFWDHDLGPDEPRLLAGPPGEPVAWQDLTPQPGAALVETDYDVTPDGTTVVAQWRTPQQAGTYTQDLVAIDVATGERRTIATGPGYLYAPRISPDGRTVAFHREAITSPTTPPDVELVLVDLDGGEPRVVAPGWDRWPLDHAWSADGTALFVVADEGGRAPVFRVDVADGGVTRLTGDDGAYSDLAVAADGTALYALRSAIDTPPAPVRLDPATPGQQPVLLRGPAEAPAPPGTLTEVTATAADGTPLRSWLVLPEGAGPESPAPLLLWIHGGPLGSWNAWQWRWNPWLMAARGYAVLLPDPALSTGYGLDFVRRGWGAWGDAPYTDLIALTDAALTRPDLDAEHTAAMGGSFGGYMANWVATQTDRFRAIVTHASLWSLERFVGVTDLGSYWAREMTDAVRAAHSPDRGVAAIRTPMLVIHGDKDYRVPISEGLALWYDLHAHFDGEPADFPHRFLYFPDENHWILAPHNAVTWYRTVFAFLDQHVHGKDWATPEGLA